MKEYAVYKGIGDSYVEIYRSDDKSDAIDRMFKSAAKRGRDCDRYSETLASQIMIWNESNTTHWLEVVEEQKNA